MGFRYIAVNNSIKMQQAFSVSLLDVGFLYGYGLFETVLIRNLAPKLLHEHIARLRYSAELLGIDFNFSTNEIEEIIQDLLSKNDVQETDNIVLNIYLTAGDRTEESPYKLQNSPLLLMVLRKRSQLTANITLTLKQESYRRTQLDQLKTMAYIKNYLERQLNNGNDVLLYDQNQQILETTSSNVFFIKGNILFFPKPETVLPGIMREFVLDLCQQHHFQINQSPVSISQLSEFDEVFVTNSISEVQLVDKIEGVDLKSGQTAQNIQRLVRENY